MSKQPAHKIESITKMYVDYFTQRNDQHKESARMGKCGSHFDLLNLEPVNPHTTGFIKIKPSSTKKAKTKKPSTKRHDVSPYT